MASSKFSLEAILTLNDRLTGPYRKSAKNVNRINKSMMGGFTRLNSSINRVGKAGAVALGAGLASGIGLATVAIKKMATEASKIEDATAGFTPLMGSVEKATELVNRLNKEAATTPFQFEGISSVAKQLLPAMNGSIEDTANTFRMLGDTAGGNIQKLESITRGYTKALLKGKPDMEALNMISEAGVPIFSEMAKSMGITVKQLFELSKQGKLTNTDLTKTFKTMTSEGGLFFKGMEISSQTLTGKISTLKDNISLAVASLGTALLPVLKKVTDRFILIAGKVREWATANQGLIEQKIESTIKAISETLKNIDFKAIINGFKEITEKIKSFKQFMSANIGIISAVAKVILVLVAAFKVLVAIMTVYNAVMLANPTTWIILGIVAAVALLVAAGIQIAKNWDTIMAGLSKLWLGFKSIIMAGVDIIVSGFWKFVNVLILVGKGFMTYLLAPVNLVIEAIQGLLTLISKIPGVGNKLKPALDTLQNFQNGMNKVTLMGETTNKQQVEYVGNNIPPQAMQAMQTEQNQKDRETKQRYDINLNAPSGYSMGMAGQTPSTSVQLGVQ